MLVGDQAGQGGTGRGLAEHVEVAVVGVAGAAWLERARVVRSGKRPVQADDIAALVFGLGGVEKLDFDGLACIIAGDEELRVFGASCGLDLFRGEVHAEALVQDSSNQVYRHAKECSE